ncbi:MAG: TIGR01459 family HAD-type hydrolase [Pseudomonadota bacterium]
MATFQFIDGLAAVADRFQGFIIDQWGVLHNGTAPYPGVLETLAELQRRNKRMVLLSNSGMRTRFNREQLREMGFNPGMFAGIVTSGEASWLALRDKTLPGFDTLGRKAFLITREGNREIIEDLDLEIVSGVEAADFVMLAGTDPPPATFEDYLPVLEAALQRDLPVVCSNPDVVAATIHGNTMAPGMLAEKYKEMGGTAHYVGKPHRPIYDACLAALEGLERTDIIAIGDSLAHDIKGAQTIGLTSVFVTEGIHKEELADASPAALTQTIAELATQHGAWPDYVLPSLSW